MNQFKQSKTTRLSDSDLFDAIRRSDESASPTFEALMNEANVRNALLNRCVVRQSDRALLKR